MVVSNKYLTGPVIEENGCSGEPRSMPPTRNGSGKKATGAG